MSSVTKVLEISSASSTSIEDAVQLGLAKVGETIKAIKGAWVNEISVVTSDDGRVTQWRVNLRVNFLVE